MKYRGGAPRGAGAGVGGAPTFLLGNNFLQKSVSTQTNEIRISRWAEREFIQNTNPFSH